MEAKLMLRTGYKFMLVSLFSAILFVLAAPELHAATVTYIVGTCKVGTRFTTIQDALNATPAPTIVEVCPGTYPEQVTISKPVTLEGVPSGESSLVTLVPPSGGMVPNATLLNGDSAAVQILIQNVAGAVNLTNLYVNSSNADVGGVAVVAVLYKNTPGTINHLTTFNVSATDGGFGVYLAGGSANPKVTIQNSTFDHDQTGLWVQSNSTSSELTAIFENNLATFCATCIDVEAGATVTISNNMINTNGEIGIALAGSTGSVTGNTIVGGGQLGISSGDAGFSITSNKIYDATAFGILLDISTVSANVTGNTLTNIAGVGIGFCGSPGTPNKVHSNTFVDSNIGYNAPSGFSITGNTFIGVITDAMEPCT
jgi:Right handed beta helix region